MDMVRTHVPRRPERRPVERAPAVVMLACALLCAHDAMAQAVTVDPRLDASLTWTDNAGTGGFDDGDGFDRGQDWILELAPGIAINRRSGRANGSLNASFRNIMYASNSDENTAFVELSGVGEFEAVEDSLFIDADASVSRSNLSLFSGRPAGDPLAVDSSDETRVWSIGPRYEFLVGDNNRGTLSYRSRWLDSGGGSLGDQRVDTWSADLANPTATRLFGWGLSYGRSDTEYGDSASFVGDGSRSEEDGRATLFIRVAPDFRLRAIAGYESNDYGNRGRESSDIVGGGFDWNPTERTAISGTVEERIFGRGYDFSFQHRMARTTWSLSYSRDIESALDTLAGGGLLDPDLLFLFNNPNFLPQITDPILREAIIRQLLGLPPIGSRGTILSNAYFVTRGLTGAVTISARRSVVSLLLSRSERTRLGDPVGLGPQDDLRDFDAVTSTAATLSFSQNLTPNSSFDAALTRSRSEGQGPTATDTQRTLFSVGISSQLGPDTSGSLRYRHQRADGGSSGRDFTENAVTASVGMRF